jgi:hypothetical protein
MFKTSAIGVVAVVLYSPSLGLAQTSDPASVVNYCVGVVNTTTPDNEFMGMFYRDFDAYYEPTTKMVHWNAKSIGAQKPLFQFKKCMSKQGLPLDN